MATPRQRFWLKVDKTELTEDDVIAIRKLYDGGGHTHRSLAKNYNVSSPTITSILNRRTWTHV